MVVGCLGGLCYAFSKILWKKRCKGKYTERNMEGKYTFCDFDVVKGGGGVWEEFLWGCLAYSSMRLKEVCKGKYTDRKMEQNYTICDFSVVRGAGEGLGRCYAFLVEKNIYCRL